ncbi:hypothetical protein [Pseudoxanthomonas sp. JBR18]|uniref:hypothetical protein n=1 Tax=Pseudoxanthomonas sp. JBR18 TaxID=2969308 RepID=UPI002306102F|nr:hypothetical protein [Pseudoxanthomonas sp. JBR18]WCE04126.1 hypothetical protein PJ250_18960 [Pseudoxanthomonas sp. JBR18]
MAMRKAPAAMQQKADRGHVEAFFMRAHRACQAQVGATATSLRAPNFIALP